VDEIIGAGIPVIVFIGVGEVVETAAVNVCTALTVVGEPVLVGTLDAVVDLTIKDDIRSLIALASVMGFGGWLLLEKNDFSVLCTYGIVVGENNGCCDAGHSSTLTDTYLSESVWLRTVVVEEPDPKLGIAVGFDSCIRFDKVTFVLLMPFGRTELTFVGKPLLGSLLANLFFISSVVFQNVSVGFFTLRVVLFTVLLTTFTNESINLFGYA
jgi:hypothetical protein